MFEKTFARLAIMASCVVACLGFTCPIEAQQPATLTIHADQPVSSVSPTLYGLMTEEINYSYDGGLYAEMVRNRTFRSDWSGVLYWYLLENGSAAAKMEVDKTTGPSEALPSSLRLDVEHADTQNQAGVLNVGWLGFALRPETTYKGSFYAKAGSSELGLLNVSLVSDDTGKAVATATIPAIGTDWKKYEFALKTGALQPSSNNHLVLSVGHAGTLWLNLVSLFPPTYHDRVNGNRIDLMEKLAAMHPNFLRFPGGNYLEGDHVADRFQWKKTIGPLVDRPTHPSPWMYHSSDGMGLLEFLGWCEDLKMNPVLAVYAGYSLQGEHVNPGADLEPYVQDALDEIEYVTGGPDTKWGAERVKNGHPAPFKLTYVEIGNEDWFDKSNSYDGRFNQFCAAINKKYPKLLCISTVDEKNYASLRVVTGPKPYMVDEHYYQNSWQMQEDASRYDSYDRKTSPKIFVGEWATREGAPTTNLIAALGDAAWMTGMERNSDVVIMSCYAPLFVNVNTATPTAPKAWQWDSDLIGYNALNSYGSPSYYVQKLFSQYLGNKII